MIRASNLTKVFTGGLFRKKTVALNRLNLHIRKGEIFGYLGPNGAGKTTSIKLFVGLIRPSSGEVKIMNEDVHSPKIRKIIGFLPENPFFYDYLTAEEFLDFCASIYRLEKNTRKERIKFLLNLIGLYEVRKRQLRTFSKGMLQKIGIAQALINDPELIILDEPMIGLDPVGRKNIKDLIFQLKEEGKTIFFSTHILSDVEILCDRIGILVKGELRSCGAIDEILKTEDIQIEVIISGIDFITYSQLKNFSESVVKIGNRAIIKINTEEKLNEIFKFSMNKKLTVESVNRHRRTLEEIFLKQINEIRD
jgi:ABC-2 type transport system ATP-binding protein